MITRSSLASSSYNLPSIVTLLKKCKSQTQLHQIHARIIRKGLEQNPYLISIFLSLSSSSLSYSSSVFDRIYLPNTLLWNCLIKGYSKRFLFRETVSLFVRMKRDAVADPDDYTYPLVIKVCAGEREVWFGKALHGSAVRCGFDRDVFVGSSLVDFYGKCIDITCARKLFDEMPHRTVVSWTALLLGYVSIGDLGEATKVFDNMPERNVASWNALIGGFVKALDLVNARKVFDKMPERNIVSYTALINGYAKAGDMVSARALFERAPDVDIVACSALISGYVQNGQPVEAINIFHAMHSRNVKPDEFIMVGLMSACSQVGSLELAKWVDSFLRRSSLDLSRQHVMAARIDMNAKCGNLDRAKKLFNDMPNRDVISYCSLMQGLAVHGHGEEAVCLFNSMLTEGLVPDKVAFTVILAACSRSRLVEEGLKFFNLMLYEYSIEASPDHYAVVVDLLSRSSRLREAYELIKLVPVEPHASAWGALLEACSLHSNTELGEVVANHLFELEPQSAGSYVLLSNIYAASERWLDVARLRERMKENGVKKICGRSWIS